MIPLTVLEIPDRERFELIGEEVAMIQKRMQRDTRLSTDDAPSMAHSYRQLHDLREGARPGSDEIQDLLGSMTDRPDLERLFAKRVGLVNILKLMGRQISREQILELIESPHLDSDLRKLLK